MYGNAKVMTKDAFSCVPVMWRSFFRVTLFSSLLSLARSSVSPVAAFWLLYLSALPLTFFATLHRARFISLIKNKFIQSPK